ncbi:hypothetical protein CY34DRAFT_811512 [Suillus luteus UH-Slu-Lm8-n1]|uniref:Unplaced genomic scaffold CY34scaffold_424, whole genome shotgun sequence n=1 Tax=Suillus luteus UH-Slu-Lm8-n1 TaxID=930992 RepID=A0A0D0AW97_9AGAM|nr:hypothetical protein CY34DRAFT_811512 [Suillus luteus UH-Slu-Lm8-n1]
MHSSDISDPPTVHGCIPDRCERDLQECGEPEQSYGCQSHLKLQHVTLAHSIH